MINLLPDESKRDIRAARMNVILLRYNIIVIGAMVLLALFCLAFYVILHTSQSNALSTNQSNTTKAMSYTKVRQEANEYESDLAVASKILSSSTSYTNIITSITKLVPSGVILDAITLNSLTIGQQTSFTAHAMTYDDATQLKTNFQKSNLFSNVYFQNLSSNPQVGGQGSPYPVAVVLSAKLNKVAGND